MVRLHAARHSALVMCVAGSQKPIQASRLLPPPPGALGADSLGEAGDRAKLLFGVPPVANWVCCWGESGATGAACGAACPTCDGGTGMAELFTGGCGGVVAKVPRATLEADKDPEPDGVSDMTLGSGGALRGWDCPPCERLQLNEHRRQMSVPQRHRRPAGWPRRSEQQSQRSASAPLFHMSCFCT